MKIKKEFNLNRIEDAFINKLKGKDLKAEALARRAFRAGAAITFHKVVNQAPALGDKKAVKALDFLEDQVSEFCRGELSPEALSFVEKLKSLFGDEGRSSRADLFDIRDEDVKEKHEASLQDLKNKIEEDLASEDPKIKSFKICGREFLPGQVDEAIAWAREDFNKKLEVKRERLKQRTAKDEAPWIYKWPAEEAGRKSERLKAEAASLADDVQPDKHIKTGEDAEDEAFQKFNASGVN